MNFLSDFSLCLIILMFIHVDYGQVILHGGASICLCSHLLMGGRGVSSSWLLQIKLLIHTVSFHGAICFHLFRDGLAGP